jgi:hypothetical protein
MRRGAQCTLHELDGMLSGRQAAPSIQVSIERGMDRVRRMLSQSHPCTGPGLQIDWTTVSTDQKAGPPNDHART